MMRMDPISFVLILHGTFDFLVTHVSDQSFATTQEIDQYEHESDNQQNVNESADGVTAHQTEQPENEKNDRDCV